MLEPKSNGYQQKTIRKDDGVCHAKTHNKVEDGAAAELSSPNSMLNMRFQLRLSPAQN